MVTVLGAVVRIAAGPGFALTNLACAKAMSGVANASAAPNSSATVPHVLARRVGRILLDARALRRVELLIALGERRELSERGRLCGLIVSTTPFLQVLLSIAG